MLTFNATRPVLLGRLAVYAPDLETARQAYEVIESETQTPGVRHCDTQQRCRNQLGEYGARSDAIL